MVLLQEEEREIPETSNKMETVDIPRKEEIIEQAEGGAVDDDEGEDDEEEEEEDDGAKGDGAKIELRKIEPPSEEAKGKSSPDSDEDEDRDSNDDNDGGDDEAPAPSATAPSTDDADDAANDSEAPSPVSSDVLDGKQNGSEEDPSEPSKSAKSEGVSKANETPDSPVSPKKNDPAESDPDPSASTAPAQKPTPGIRVKTLKDLMPDQRTQQQNGDCSAVQRLTQQVERLPQTLQPSASISRLGSAVSISSSVQLMKRPATSTPDSSGSSQNKVPRLPDSITVTVPQKASSKPAAPPQLNSGVANLLSRGVTVTPSGQQRSQVQASPTPGTATVAKSRFPVSNAVTILPRKAQPTANPASRLPTVDLTGSDDVNPAARRRSQSRPSFTCQICDKSFPNNEQLQRHAASHRSSSGATHSNRPFPCNLCRVVYNSEAALNAHKQQTHPTSMGPPSRGGYRGSPAQPEMAIPIVDMSLHSAKEKLWQAGIRYVVRLSDLTSSEANSQYALPIVPIDQANNPAFCNIAGIGASNLLPLGPLMGMNN